ADELSSPDQRGKDLISTGLKVLTWNIWWRYGPWKERERRLIETIRKLDPDLVCLQEVWREGAEDQAQLLGAALGLKAAFAEAEPRPGEIGFGNAILSRWPIVKEAVRPLPPAPSDGSGGRIALFAEIDGPRGRIGAFSTHLSWKHAESGYRQAQVRELCRFVDENKLENYPPIICGDFNAEPDAREVQMMTGADSPVVEGLAFIDVWRYAAPDDPGLTWDNRNEFVARTLEYDRRIDYIFVGEPTDRNLGLGHPLSCRVAGNELIDGMYPSDHFAVMAELRY
ncbi:MAG: endonuclease/exonuclease/phosphatase family protein, partial [Kiloniellales bacterium]|nr:endonuclease/exonuclease/phosphatase family protein [Kiloniellales bacterium]